MAVWTDKSLICLRCCTACHQHHQQQQQLLSHTLLGFILFVFFQVGNEWIHAVIVHLDLWEANLQMLSLCPVLQLSNPHADSQTDRDIRLCMHEHTATLISRQAKRAGGQEDKVCLNIGFSTAGGCWTCSIRQTSIKVSVWVMRPDSHRYTLSASRSAWWPSVWARKDQRQTRTKSKK